MKLSMQLPKTASFPTSKKQVLKFFLRGVIAAEIGFLIATVVNVFSYKAYWHGTIFRVQTVDFNIISHSMPTKLSYALIQNNTQELQNTLNSNFGLFGLIVTDCATAQDLCPDQKILYATQTRMNYAELVKPQDLLKYSYDVLRDPPPLSTEHSYSSPADPDRTTTGLTNPGKIIGRVYYIRRDPPKFLADYLRWLRNPLADSGTARIYTLTFVLFTAGVSLFWSFLDIKRLRDRNKLIELDKARLEAENKHNESVRERLETENRLAITEQERLEAENRKSKAEQERLAVENKLLRLKGFVGGFQEIIEQDFSSVVANHLEELRGVFRRLNTDVDNITHDMYKAPLLAELGSSSRVVEKLDKHLADLSEDKKDSVIQSVIEFIKDTGRTVDFIDWTLKDLRGITNLNAERIKVQDGINQFLGNLPPNMQKPWLEITYEDQSDAPLWIMCNLWHLRSVAKNVLYNSSAALAEYQYEFEDENFQGKIKISSFREGDKAGISISDNGPGFSEEALKKLYQTPGKVYEARRGGRGSIIVYSYLALHNGEVRLTNLPEGGACATFLFPLVFDSNQQ